MTRRHTPLLVFLSLLLTFNSCSVVYSVLLGIDSRPEWVDTKYLEKRARKLGLPMTQVYQLDTMSLSKVMRQPYVNLRDSLAAEGEFDHSDTLALKKEARKLKDDMQPVHIRYFDKNGAPLYWMINCYVEPLFPRMNWNIDSSFNFFPPRPFSPLNDTLRHDLSFFLPHIRQADNSPLSMQDLPEADYYVLILWNDIYKRPSRRLIELEQKYHQKHSDKKVHVLYVNNQNAYLWPLMTPEQREEALKGD